MRTLEKPPGSTSTRTATAARTIAGDARVGAVPVVLSDFETVEVTAPVAQDELKQIQAHFMTVAQCSARGITDPAERAKAAQALHERMARYGT